MSSTNDIEKRTLTIERTLDAPRALVWEAWTDPNHIANWWGPKHMKTDIKKHDFTEGGDWEYSMVMPDGKEFRSFGTFTRIVAPELIEFSANFIPMTEGVTIVVNLQEHEDKTQFIFKVIHPSEEYCKQQEDMGFYNGWSSVFNNLEEYLADQI